MLWSVKLAAMGPHWGVTGSQHRWTPLWKGQMSKIEWKVSYSFIKWVKLDSSRLMHVIDTPQGVVKGGEKKRRDEKWWGRERERHKTWEGQRLRHSEGRWRGGGGRGRERELMLKKGIWKGFLMSFRCYDGLYRHQKTCVKMTYTIHGSLSHYGNIT